MAANVSPIFPLTPNPGVMNALLTTAMTNTKAFDGTEAAGTAMVLAMTAGANGARLDSITVRVVSTNGATASSTTTATLVRFWINNASANTTATNNQLLGELEIPAVANVALATAKNPVFTLAIPKGIPATYRIYAGLTVAIGGTNCALEICPDAGDY
jgi:hypothetical protein